MPEQIKFKKEAIPLLREGVNTLVNAVKVTLGPKGQNVIISNNGMPHVTKDGVTVCKSIFLNDPYENLGAELIKQAASKTVSECGDSTTTCCILAQFLINNGLLLNQKYNRIEVKAGMDKAVQHVTKYLNDNSISIDKSHEVAIEDIATVSANNDSYVGSSIADIYKKIGLAGVIQVEASDYNQTEIEVSKGMKVNRGYVSPVFINNSAKNTVEFEDPFIHIVRKKITNISEIKDVMTSCAQHDRSLLIIAEDFDSQVLSSLSVNNAKGVLKVCAVKSPGFADRRDSLLDDIEVYTNEEKVTYFTAGMNSVPIAQYGAKKVIISQESTLIIDGYGNTEKINHAVKTLQESIDNCKNPYTIKDYENRIANLIGGVATIYVGAPTEVEMLELKDRYDDAICAVKAAILGGISVGGGLAFMNAYKHCVELKSTLELSEAESIGYNLILESLCIPYNQIQINAGFYDYEIKAFTDPKIGFNAKTMKAGVLIDEGVIDPTNSLISALKNAASVASMLITTECAIILNQ